MKPKLVIFDLDGTLADTIELIVFSLNQALSPIWGRAKSREELYALFGPTEEVLIDQEAGDQAEAALARFRRVYETHLSEFVTVFPGIVDLLKQLQHERCSLGLVTNKGRWSTDVTLEALKIASYFRHSSTGEEARPKPHPDGIVRLMEAFGATPAETAMIGDSPGDIKAARAAGVQAVGAGWGSTYEIAKLEAAQPDALCLQPKDVISFFEAADRNG